ncbi:MAG: hypothetical protein PHH06_01255 [Candidatus Gracilibacteria bacterium]|nr:hypothetical protein [Candidatus Gracilibacteria bacterium]
MESISKNDILEAAEDGVISLSELTLAIQDRLNNTLVGDTPIKALPIIQKIKTPTTTKETDRLNEVETYLNNTADLRSNSNKPTLQESNGVVYLALGEDNIFEVREQRGDVYIAYHPIKQMYIVYKFLGEDSDQNTSLLGGLNSIDKTNIDGYYKFNSSRNIEFSSPWSVFGRSDVKKHETSYYFISENGETQSFGDYKSVSELKKHGKAVFFTGYTSGVEDDLLVIHNGDKVEKIPSGWNVTRKSVSGKNLLWIQYNLGNNNKDTKHTLIDLDNMNIIFEQADKFTFNVGDSENGVGTFEDEISWEFYEKRQGVAKLLGKKVIRYSTVL